MATSLPSLPSLPFKIYSATAPCKTWAVLGCEYCEQAEALYTGPESFLDIEYCCIQQHARWIMELCDGAPLNLILRALVCEKEKVWFEDLISEMALPVTITFRECY